MKLSKDQINILKNLFSELDNISVLVFGSRIKQTNKEFSDLDICLRGEGEIDILLIGSLNEKITNSNLPFFVDISDYHRIPQSFQKRIDREAIELETLY